MIRKISLISKLLTLQPGLQTIAIHILPNISQSKGNQTMKFGQLIEYNKRNIFLQKLCRKWGRETSSRLVPDYWSRDMLNFNFSEKGLGLVSPPHFVYGFSRKMFLLLHTINWTNFIVWLLLLLEILGNISITIVC